MMFYLQGRKKHIDPVEEQHNKMKTGVEMHTRAEVTAISTPPLFRRISRGWCAREVNIGLTEMKATFIH